MMIAGIETERADLFDVSILIAMRIHIKGRVNESRIREAFDNAVNVHEILKSRVVIESDGRAFYDTKCQADGGFEATVETVVEGMQQQGAAGKKAKNDHYEKENLNSIIYENTAWRDIIKQEEKKRFRIEEGEFLKAFCYESSDEGCKILFLMHHLGGDGKSLVYFMETFMRFLSGERPTASEIRTIPAGDMDDKSLRDRIGPAYLFPKVFNNRWNKDDKRRTFGFDDMNDAYEEYWKDRESVINEHVIPTETVAKILERCRQWKVGFTAYVTTAFLRRMVKKADIGYAVDARKDGNRCMGNQATGISIKYAYDYNRSFRENVIKVQKLMDKKLEDDELREFILPFMASFEPTLVDAINLEHAGPFTSKASKSLAKLMGYGKKTKDLSITNLTRLDIPDTYGELKISYFSFIPPVVSYGKNIIGLSTLGENTVMTVHRIRKT